MTFECLTCGHSVPETATFCQVCGTSFVGPPPAANPNSVVAALPPPPAGAPWPPPIPYVPVNQYSFGPPQFDPADPPRPPRSVRTIALTVILVVPVVVGTAIAYYNRMPVAAERSTAQPVVSYPNQWDPRVEAIAEFVEHERGLAFEHPVEVDFLTDQQYHDVAVADDDAGATDDETPSDDVMSDDDFVAQYRAIGLISGEVDLSAADDTLVGSGTLAFYSPDDKRARVRGVEMTPQVRVTLAHELTHALQDQTFDLSHGRNDRPSTRRAIVEGDAKRIEWAYEATVLTEAERAEKASADEADRTAYEALLATSSVPSVLSTTFELPYAVGPQFVQITAAAGGNGAVDVITRVPPESDVALLDPLRPSFGRPNAYVPEPQLPDGGVALDRSPMGAGLLFLWLGERMEPAAALMAASSWNGESSVIFRWKGRVCFDANFYTDGRDNSLLTALSAWAAAMPAEAGAVVAGSGNDVYVHTCDPGADVAFTVAGRTEQTLTFAAIRSEIELELVRDANETSARSACIADAGARTISAADLANDSFDMSGDPLLVAAIQKAFESC